MKTHAIAATVVLCTLVCPAATQAQTNSQTKTASGAAVLEPFARCRTIPAAETRADCFDAAARALEAAVAAKDVRIVGRQDVREARRSLFGFTLPRIGLLGDGSEERDERGEDEEFKEIQTTITSVRPLANGRVELRIAEGDAVWVTTDPMPFPPKPGRKVRIRKGAIGNYFIAIEGERSVRGTRLR